MEMINKDDYRVRYGHLESTKAGIRHFHFHIDGPNDKTICFFTYEDKSGYKCSNLSDPLDYISFGMLLLLFEDRIKEEMILHCMDRATPLLDHMKKET